MSDLYQKVLPLQENFLVGHTVRHTTTVMVQVNRNTNSVRLSAGQFLQETRVSRALNQQQKLMTVIKGSNNKKTYIDRRSKKRRALFKLYETRQEEVKYHKNMLLPVQPEAFRRDHTFSF